jgi:hypothetical protein
MRDRRWHLFLAGLGAVAVVMLMSNAPLQPVTAARESPPRAPALAACAPPASALGAWYRLDERVDDRGGLDGYTIRLGGSAGDPETAMEAPAESFAAGPFGGVVVVGTDDGRASTVRLVVAESGCAAVVLTTSDVVRRATVDRDGRFLYTHRVSRRDRADLGVWRDSLSQLGRATRVFGGIDTTRTRGLGRAFSTQLAWSPDGDDLAVQTCGAAECVTRVVETATGTSRSYDAEGQGALLAVTDESLVFYASCRGFPCAIRAADRASGTSRLLTAGAGTAVVSATGDTATLVVERPASPEYQLESVDVATGAKRTLFRGAAGDLRLLPAPPIALGAVSVPPGTIALSAGTRGLGLGVRLLRLTDGTLAGWEDL